LIMTQEPAIVVVGGLGVEGTVAARTETSAEYVE